MLLLARWLQRFPTTAPNLDDEESPQFADLQSVIASIVRVWSFLIFSEMPQEIVLENLQALGELTSLFWR